MSSLFVLRSACFRGHPFVTSTLKSGLPSSPSPHERDPSPLCGRPHAVRTCVRKLTLFLGNLKVFGFWVSGRQIFYISSTQISEKIYFPHVNHTFFNCLLWTSTCA